MVLTLLRRCRTDSGRTEVFTALRVGEKNIQISRIFMDHSHVILFALLPQVIATKACHINCMEGTRPEPTVRPRFARLPRPGCETREGELLMMQGSCEKEQRASFAPNSCIQTRTKVRQEMPENQNWEFSQKNDVVAAEPAISLRKHMCPVQYALALTRKYNPSYIIEWKGHLQPV